MKTRVSKRSEADCAFRFIGLTSDECEALKVLYPNTSWDVHHKSGENVCCVPVDDETHLEPLIIFADGCDSKVQKGLWVSFITSHDNGGLTLGDNLLQLLHRTGCGFDFSYIYLGKDA